MTPPVPHFDVLIVGAGLSGIGAAWHLEHECPGVRYAILESRTQMGGTWDLFRYPGIRSDSDMYTLGYRFRPWRNGKAIADGPAIKAYIEETARESGIDRHIRFGHRMVRAEWSSAASRWTIDVEVDGGRRHTRFSCGFVYSCTGYYDYTQGYTPAFPGRERFRGRIVHPQHWPDDLDYADQRVVVIGSGATAVTLVPAMLDATRPAAHVTMLQRSPSYIATLPSEDTIANALRRVLPESIAYGLTRWKNIARSMFYYRIARTRPDTFKRALQTEARAQLGPDFPLEPHFTPRYDPWDERLCMAPDGDLFRVLRERRATVVTDTIVHFDETGIQLASGTHLDADLIITATGLQLSVLAGVSVVVDGTALELARHLLYKGMMLNDVPNWAASVGYTNASWTLKSDLIAQHVCRLLRYMRANGYARVTPRRDPTIGESPVFDFTSGYVQRARASLPRQGDRAPWRLYQNYVKDLLMLRYGRVDDPALEFRRPPTV